MTTWEYLAGDETTERRELKWGTLVREPAPTYGHQAVVTNLTALLTGYVKTHNLGRVCVSPVDVVFDEARNLVLQPDVIFVSRDRLSILRDRVWGAPDLVIEVISSRSDGYDRGDKRRWYAEYGVREYWILDPALGRIEVNQLGTDPEARRMFEGAARVESSVLPGLELRASDAFQP